MAITVIMVMDTPTSTSASTTMVITVTTDTTATDTIKAFVDLFYFKLTKLKPNDNVCQVPNKSKHNRVQVGKMYVQC